MRLQIRREDVVLGVLGAIEMAREQGDAGAMISDAAELNKMLGFYEKPEEHESAVDVTLIKRIEAMSEEELLSRLERDDSFSMK